MLCDALAARARRSWLTGAIRPADAPGADGPANLADSIVAAAAPVTEGAGGLVCFAGELHAARRCARSTPPRRTRSPPRAAARSPGSPRGAWTSSPSRCAARGCRCPRRWSSGPRSSPPGWATTGPAARGGRHRPGRARARGLGGGHTSPRGRSRRCASAIQHFPCVRRAPERGHLLRETYGYEGPRARRAGHGRSSRPPACRGPLRGCCCWPDSAPACGARPCARRSPSAPSAGFRRPPPRETRGTPAVQKRVLFAPSMRQRMNGHATGQHA